jgi:tryptophan halogenase
LEPQAVEKIVIVGGGTAGWMTASALSKVLGPRVNIRLIESEEIGTVGVGEATIPQINIFNSILGIDENDFVAKTNGTFKLGIEFVNWHRQGERYMHAFGGIGRNLGFVPFHHYWMRQNLSGKETSLWEYSAATKSAYANRFDRLERLGASPLPGPTWAFQFDAGLYARYLRGYSEYHGVRRTEGKVRSVELDGLSGFIQSVTLESGEVVSGDLFVDCSGFRGLLIEGALETGYEDWSNFLPCDRALAVPCESVAPLTPYTRATARHAGWQWRIPLQHRIGNGHVYCSAFTSDEEAERVLMSNLDGKPLADPRPLKFVTGRRKKLWNKNCIAVGLASGFMEPLESTSIHLIQSAVSRLITLFPTKACDTVLSDEYNQQAIEEYALIRDFLILHYHANARTDSPFWLHCQNMAIPDSLSHKIELFRKTGRIERRANDLFAEPSWLQVLIGQGIRPESYHALARDLSDEDLDGFLGNVSTIIAKAVDQMPSHEDFIARNCRAPAT